MRFYKRSVCRDFRNSAGRVVPDAPATTAPISEMGNNNDDSSVDNSDDVDTAPPDTGNSASLPA